MNICIRITESLSCTPEQQVHSNNIKKNFSSLFSTYYLVERRMRRKIAKRQEDTQGKKKK